MRHRTSVERRNIEAEVQARIEAAKRAAKQQQETPPQPLPTQ